MKHYYNLLIVLTLFLFTSITSSGQTTGDIAFIGMNVDGNDDIAIVALADIPANTVIYFSDNELNGAGGFVDTNEGILQWDTGAAIISAGTVVTFTDLTSTRTATNGTLTPAVGTLNLAATGDALFAYLGSDPTTPTTFLAGIQNEAGNYGDLTGSGLTEGTTFVNFYISGNPDGGAYNGTRNTKANFSDYLAEIGNNANWVIDESNGENLLPFDNTSFETAVFWTGTVDTDWATAGNWANNAVPGTTTNVVIPNTVVNYPTVNSAVTVKSIRIESGASLIANAAVTSPVTYVRNLPTTNWYLMSSPVAGETIEDLIANHTFATGTGANIGLADYLNSGATPWNYQNAASTGTVNSGQGYSVKLASAGDVSFTGTLNSSNVNSSITTGTRTNFNLVGNPFTAYVESSAFLTDNSLSLTEETMWLWDGTQYVAYNEINTIDVAPGQGFFVDAASNSSLVFDTTNQSHQADTFMRQTPKPSFELFVESDETKKSTKVFYVNDKTAGFDNGYDSKMFGEQTIDFGVFTQLVADDKGNKLAIQTLPNADHETMVVPVGLIAEAGKDITFSVQTENLPNGIQVYLEDRINNTFVNLSEGNHTVTTDSASNGIGQYYIHTTSARLSSDDITNNIANVSIYTSGTNEITVAGLQAKATVAVYSLLGEELVNTSINSNGVSKVQLPNLATGVYVVKLNSALGNITKKIILE